MEQHRPKSVVAFAPELPPTIDDEDEKVEESHRESQKFPSFAPGGSFRAHYPGSEATREAGCAFSVPSRASLSRRTSRGGSR